MITLISYKVMFGSRPVLLDDLGISYQSEKTVFIQLLTFMEVNTGLH